MVLIDPQPRLPSLDQFKFVILLVLKKIFRLYLYCKQFSVIVSC